MKKKRRDNGYSNVWNISFPVTSDLHGYRTGGIRSRACWRGSRSPATPVAVSSSSGRYLPHALHRLRGQEQLDAVVPVIAGAAPELTHKEQALVVCDNPDDPRATAAPAALARETRKMFLVNQPSTSAGATNGRARRNSPNMGGCRLLKLKPPSIVPVRNLRVDRDGCRRLLRRLAHCDRGTVSLEQSYRIADQTHLLDYAQWHHR